MLLGAGRRAGRALHPTRPCAQGQVAVERHATSVTAPRGLPTASPPSAAITRVLTSSGTASRIINRGTRRVEVTLPGDVPKRPYRRDEDDDDDDDDDERNSGKVDQPGG